MPHFAASIPERITSQYKDSNLLIEYMQSMATEGDVLEDQIIRVINERVINVAIGQQLDTLGRLLGVSRVVIDFQGESFFGFEGDPTALRFDSLTEIVPDAGRYRSLGEQSGTSRRLGDEEYRVLIISRILTLSTPVTPNDCLFITRQVLTTMFVGGQDIPLSIEEKGNAVFDIIISAELTAVDQAFIAFLDLVPRPAGVRINYVYITPVNTLQSEDGLLLFYQDNTEIEIQ